MTVHGIFIYINTIYYYISADGAYFLQPPLPNPSACFP